MFASDRRTEIRGALLALATCLTMALGAAPAFCDEPPAPAGPPPRHQAPDPERMLQHLTQRLDLSADQVEQVRPILEDQAEAMNALREELGPPWDLDDEGRAEFGDRAREIQEAADTRLTQVLTEKQMEDYRAMRHQRRRMPPPEGQSEKPETR